MADISTAAVGASSTPNIQPISEQDFAQIKPVATKQPVEKVLTPAEEKKQKEQEQQPLLQPGTVPEETVSQITEAFNELMDEINCDLELSFNREVNMLNVKMRDKKTGEVIKEFPPEKMIENMIKADENAEKLRGMFVDRAV
ncbi:MAG: flagellar protein FlaG [Selenomonadaceae bacterium]|nr:flagellar protein FlaG [Selenomonadaceae bacterium]